MALLVSFWLWMGENVKLKALWPLLLLAFSFLFVPFFDIIICWPQSTGLSIILGHPKCHGGFVFHQCECHGHCLRVGTMVEYVLVWG